MPWKDIPLFPIPEPAKLIDVQNTMPLRIVTDRPVTFVNAEKIMIGEAVITGGFDTVNSGFSFWYVDVINSTTFDIYHNEALDDPVDNRVISGAGVWTAGTGATYPFQEVFTESGPFIVDGEIYHLVDNPNAPLETEASWRMVKLVGESFVEVDAANSPQRLSFAIDGLTIIPLIMDGLVRAKEIIFLLTCRVISGGGPTDDRAYAFRVFDTETDTWGPVITSTTGIPRYERPFPNSQHGNKDINHAAHVNKAVIDADGNIIYVLTQDVEVIDASTHADRLDLYSYDIDADTWAGPTRIFGTVAELDHYGGPAMVHHNGLLYMFACRYFDSPIDPGDATGDWDDEGELVFRTYTIATTTVSSQTLISRAVESTRAVRAYTEPVVHFTDGATATLSIALERGTFRPPGGSGLESRWLDVLEFYTPIDTISWLSREIISGANDPSLGIDRGNDREPSGGDSQLALLADGDTSGAYRLNFVYQTSISDTYPLDLDLTSVAARKAIVTRQSNSAWGDPVVLRTGEGTDNWSDFGLAEQDEPGPLFFNHPIPFIMGHQIVYIFHKFFMWRVINPASSTNPQKTREFPHYSIFVCPEGSKNYAFFHM